MKLYYSHPNNSYWDDPNNSPLSQFNIWLPLNEQTGRIIASSMSGNIGHVGILPYINGVLVGQWKGHWIEV